MRRRVARVLRWLLLFAGVGILVWYPWSWFTAAGCSLPWPYTRGALAVWDGNIHCAILNDPWQDAEQGFDVWVHFESYDDTAQRDTLWPSFGYYKQNGAFAFLEASIPLWLLAFLCLAWPVTSFLIARRRHKRGFPMVPKGGEAAVSTADSSR